MLDALAGGNTQERRWALGSAFRLGLLDYKLLTTALNDQASTVRRRAAELAPRLASSDPAMAETLAPALIRLLDDDSCAEVAAFALGELGSTDDAIVESLARTALGHDDALVRESAVAALGSLGRGLSAVLAATEDIATVRRRAVIALAAFEGDDVDRALRAALTDRDWQVRQAAEDLLHIEDSPPDR